MRFYLIFILLSAPVSLVWGQSDYEKFVKLGDSLYAARSYKEAAIHYSLAFKSNGWKGAANDRYNAACSWALAGVADSAFFQLERIARKGGYSNYDHITKDTDLISLYSDKRWKPLLELVQQNREKEEANFNKPLVRQLDTIFENDQKHRRMVADIEKKHGWESDEMRSLWKIINKHDSVNRIIVTGILDRHGWLGADVIGGKGNMCLFLVIQHADQKIQEKYLPMLRQAVKEGRASPSNLALLEDRVALGQGKKQVYGSQIHRDNATGKYFVAPIEDEANVNVRRAAVGLGPLEDYVKNWGIEYKLPAK